MMIEAQITEGGVSLGAKPVLQAQAFELQPGEFIGLVGPNGAGKSTLLKLLAGLLDSPNARVNLDGEPIRGLSRRARARRLAWLGQSRELSWDLTVEDVVALGRHAWGGGRYERLGEADRAIVLGALQRAGASALAGRHVLSLSGGEQARIHLARLFAAEADVLLLDEPLAALDVAQQLSVMAALQTECMAGKTVCMALHDLQLAREMCSRIIVLDGGRCRADGPPQTALSDAVLEAVFGVVSAEGGRFRLARP